MADRREKRKLVTQHGKENKLIESTTTVKSDKSQRSKSVVRLNQFDEHSTINFHGGKDELKQIQMKRGLNNGEYSDRMNSPSRRVIESENRRLEDSISLDKSHISDDRSTHESSHRGDPDITVDADEQSVVEIETIQCDCCKRSFAPKVYEKHFDSGGKPKCASMLAKKRPVFNAAKASDVNALLLNCYVLLF